MSRSPATDPSSELPPQEPDMGQGLTDPRTIHPSPEDLFPDPVVTPPAKRDENQNGDEPDEEAEERADE